MSETPISLNEARAVKADDCTLWTPLDCLRAIIRDIESGAISPRALFVDYVEDQSDGARFVGGYRAGLKADEELAVRSYRLHAQLHGQFRKGGAGE